MKYLSVCSGIEAATVALHPEDFEPVGFSEVDGFCQAVLSYHYPRVKNFGDLNNYKKWDVDVFQMLIGGTPCQAFSTAGSRQGMDDPRGQLALSYVGLLERYRPRWFIWENVPGVLSSNGGQDFGTFLGEVARVGYQCAWRVLDARFFGLAQNRRRVFVVGHVNDWRRAAAVLFDQEGCGGDPSAGSDRRSQIATAAVRGLADAHVQWWDGNQLSQTADAVLYKKQAMPEKNRFPAVMHGDRVRYVMPVEWERLMGFPDNYTNIPVRNGVAPDTQRYKALGNSFPVPIIRWLGQRIKIVDDIRNT